MVFGGFFLGVYYFTLYDDGTRLNNLIEEVQNNIWKVEVQIKEKEMELENIKEFEREILNEKKVIESFLKFIPESLTYTELSSLLINSAKITGVNIEVKTDQAIQIEEESEYQTLQIHLTIKGSFSQIMFFLSKLTSQKRMLILQRIDMNIEETSRLVKANLKIIAYRYQKLEKKEKKKDEDGQEEEQQ